MTEHGKRARDADREVTRGLLESAYVDGQLSQPEWERRVDRVLRASTLGELQALVRDLQIDSEEVAAPPSPRRWPRGLAVLVVFLVAAGGIRAMWPDGAQDEAAVVEAPPVVEEPVVESEPDEVVEPEPTVHEPLTLPAFRDFVRAYTAEFDASELFEPLFQAGGDVHFARPYGPLHKNRIDPMFWSPRDGFSDWAAPRTNTFNETLVDLDDINFRALARNVVHARKYLNVEDASIDVHVAASFADPSVVQIRISASNDLGERGSLTTTLTGERIRSDPFSPTGQ